MEDELYESFRFRILRKLINSFPFHLRIEGLKAYGYSGIRICLVLITKEEGLSSKFGHEYKINGIEKISNLIIGYLY